MNMRIRDLVKFNIDPVEVESYLEKLHSQESIVTVAGEFSSGKSTFLNALIGKRSFLPEALKECTPVLIDLVKSDSSEIEIVYQDGTTERTKKNENSIETYARYTRDYDKNIRMITVPVNSDYLPENVHFIDTPGSNTMIVHHESITNYIVRRSDVVLYVVNKSLNESDISRLKYIQNYTNDIVIIISHIDEGEEGYLATDTIERFVHEAHTNLNDRLGMKDVDIFPIGSVQAFTDNTFMQPIRDCISMYIEGNSMKIMKKRVEQQLMQIFGKKVTELEKNTDLFDLSLESEQAEISEKVQRFERRMKRLDDTKQSQMEHVKEIAVEQNMYLQRELALLVDQYKGSALAELIKNDATEQDIARILSQTNEALSSEVVKSTEQKVKFLLDMSYQEMNDNLEDIVQGLNIPHLKMTPPNLGELVNEIDESKVVKLHEAKEYYEQHLQEVEAQMSATIEQDDELKERRKSYEEQLDRVSREMWSLGNYQPEFTEKEIAGGASAGAKVGRFVGEVADIALIFYNPAGAAAGAADTVKDAAKIGSYLNKAHQGKKAIEVIDNVQKTKRVMHQVKKGKEVLDKVARTRQDTIDNLETYKETLPAEKQTSVLDLLDYLSLGFWGEKLGNTIGGQVKPTKTIYEENEEKRFEWEQLKESNEQSMLDIRMSIESTEREISEASSIREERRLQMQLKDKIDRQNQLIEKAKEQVEKEKTFTMQETIKLYYENEVNQLFDEILISIRKEVEVIMDYALRVMTKNNENAFEIEVNKLKNLISDLQQSRESLIKNVERNKALLEELADYPNWIKEWIVIDGNH